eukprot:gene42326-20581_t
MSDGLILPPPADPPPPSRAVLRVLLRLCGSFCDVFRLLMVDAGAEAPEPGAVEPARTCYLEVDMADAM